MHPGSVCRQSVLRDVGRATHITYIRLLSCMYALVDLQRAGLGVVASTLVTLELLT